MLTRDWVFRIGFFLLAPGAIIRYKRVLLSRERRSVKNFRKSMNDAPQEIKARLAIEDLVSQYVQLKKVGRSLKGLCPFHPEKTPSFIVSPDKGIAYCFGCHRGGDIFRFMQEIEGIDFVDALKVLAERTGVKIDKYSFEKRVPLDEKEQLLNIHQLAADFYRKNLCETKDGEKVFEYLHRRGFQDEMIRFFGIGYAPDSFEETYSMLLKSGFSRKMLVASGLALAKETTFEKIYDRFRGRLMFPVMDSFGRVIAFGGRALQKEQEPKYVNSPETPIYHKSNVLYGLSFAKSTIKEKNEVLVVEGYMDLIAAYQAGIHNVVASSGTALTLKQLQLLKPLAKILLFAFDMDQAGQEAAKRAYELAADLDFQIKIVLLPEGKDIAEFAKTRAEELPQILEQAANYGDYFYEKLLRTYGTADIAAKRKILQEFFPFLSQFRSSIEKDSFVRKLALDLDLSEIRIYDEMKNFRLPVSHPARIQGDLQPEVKKQLSDEILLGFMIEFPRIALLLRGQLENEFFQDDLKPIYNSFWDYYNGHRPEDIGGFIAVLSHDLAQKAALLSLYVVEKYGEIGEEACEREMKVLIDNLKKKIFTMKRQELQKKIREAEKAGDKNLFLGLIQELDRIK